MKKTDKEPTIDAAVVVYGTQGNDIFYGDQDGLGEPYPDVFKGLGGNDLIYGNSHADRLWGGAGKDSIYGGFGSDRLFGGPGKDNLSGGKQSDVISGGGGADIFLFEAWPYDNGGSHLDTITDFDPGERGEHIELTVSTYFQIATFSDLKSFMFEDDGDVVIDFLGRDILVLENLRINQLSADDFQIRMI
jgi:Ca2+-binding RTX toxin-like protein